jgi:hypothetical protein
MTGNHGNVRSKILRLTLCWFGLAALAVAANKTVDLGGGKSVIFTVPAGWDVAAATLPQEIAGLAKSIKLTPKNGANAECDITLMVPPDNRFADHDALKDVLVAGGEQMVADSIEGKVIAREFKTLHGFGYSATFTDKNLVGKPSVRGDYKAATTVMIYLPEQIAVTATIVCDDVNGPEYAAMIALLRSLGARSAASSI